MTYLELIYIIAESRNITKSDAENLLHEIFENISIELEHGYEISLPDFGAFSVGQSTSSPTIPMRDDLPDTPSSLKKTVNFQPSQRLKNILKLQEPVDE